MKQLTYAWHFVIMPMQLRLNVKFSIWINIWVSCRLKPNCKTRLVLSNSIQYYLKQPIGCQILKKPKDQRDQRDIIGQKGPKRPKRGQRKKGQKDKKRNSLNSPNRRSLPVWWELCWWWWPDKENPKIKVNKMLNIISPYIFFE